jgi:hypothetical protein
MTKTLRKTVIYCAPFLILVMVCGCVRTVTKDELDDWAMERAAVSFPDRTYYTGSTEKYDYFVTRSGSGRIRHRYRVRQDEAAVTGRFDRTKDETEWREYGSELVVTNSAPK